MDDRPVNLTVTLPSGSVILPSWLVLAIVGAFVLAALSLLGVWQTNREVEREIRVLQVHAMDIETVLIRSNLATRSDFAEWEPGSPRHAAKEK